MNEYSDDLITEKIKPESLLPAPTQLEELAIQGRRIYHNFTRVLQK
jgi:hypothetical protein